MAGDLRKMTRDAQYNITTISGTSITFNWLILDISLLVLKFLFNSIHFFLYKCNGKLRNDQL